MQSDQSLRNVAIAAQRLCAAERLREVLQLERRTLWTTRRLRNAMERPEAEFHAAGGDSAGASTTTGRDRR